MRLFEAWASRMPARASRYQPGLKPGLRTASRPATSPAVRVMGRTAARVRTSHLETGSSRPAGGLVVRSTSRHLDSRLGSVVTVVAASLIVERAKIGRAHV